MYLHNPKRKEIRFPPLSFPELLFFRLDRFTFRKHIDCITLFNRIGSDKIIQFNSNHLFLVLALWSIKTDKITFLLKMQGKQWRVKQTRDQTLSFISSYLLIKYFLNSLCLKVLITKLIAFYEYYFFFAFIRVNVVSGNLILSF